VLRGAARSWPSPYFDRAGQRRRITCASAEEAEFECARMRLELSRGALLGAAEPESEMTLSRIVDTMIAFPFMVLVIAVIAIVGPVVKGMLIGVPSPTAWR
jgi:hypothetical protein